MTEPTDPPQKPMLTERLTPEEIEDLRRETKEDAEYAKKVFAHLRPKEPEPAPLLTERLTPEELESLRRETQDDIAYFKETFAHLRPKPDGEPDRDP